MLLMVSSWQNWLWRVLGYLLVTSFCFTVQAGDLVLASGMMAELNAVLKTSLSLHQALVAQNEDQMELSLRDLLVELERAKSVSTAIKPHERAHLVRILDAARDSFAAMQSAFGEERKSDLVEGYNQLVNLARIYRLNTAYGIFFCPKDKTTWIQRGNKAQNPFGAEMSRESCGIKVPSQR